MINPIFSLSIALLTTIGCSQPLPHVRLSNASVTVSGISSGAFFAVQMQFAFSSLIRGAGVVAGGPYYCAQQGNFLEYAACCQVSSLINNTQLVAYAIQKAATGEIDPLENLRNHTVHLWSGTIDSFVSHGTMKKLASLYTALGVPTDNTFNFTAEHAWVTSKYGNNCSHLGPDYINNCDWDFAGRFLKATFSAAGLPWVAEPGIYAPESMLNFSQVPFGAEPNMSLDSLGFIYVPRACASGVLCQLHINFHGCDQARIEVDKAYVSRTQLNEWAESNNVVILYPQATVDLHYGNILACWNTWGYGDVDYATKYGKQATVVKRIVDALFSIPVSNIN